MGGTATLRDLGRSYVIQSWEVEQAAALGWVAITERKPRSGRPSRMATLCELENAKLPPLRRFIEREISYRHQAFALASVCVTVHRGSKFIGMPGTVAAYLEVYRPRSRAGAAASCSRLLKRRDIRALRAWFYAQANYEIPRSEPMPRTASGILRRLKELGSWRVR